MSDAIEHGDDTAGRAKPRQPQPAPKPDAGAAKAKKGKPRRRWWWRWTRRLVLTVLVARLLLWVFLEQIADFGAGFAGLSVEWRDASLSLTGLSLHIEDLVVRDASRPDAQPLFTAQELLADVATKDLFSGQVTLVDASVSGGRVAVHRLADGTLQLPPAWLEPATEQPEPEPETQPDETEPSFELPAQIASVRVHDLQLDFVDHAYDPPARYTGKLDLDVAELGYADRTGTVLLRVHAPQLCDELYVKAEVEAAARRADVRLQGAVRGFRPHGFAPPQELLDAIDDARVVDLGVDGTFTAQLLPDAPDLPALEGALTLALGLDGVERTRLEATVGPTSVGPGGLATPFGLELHCDDVVGSLALRDGRFEQHEGGGGSVAAKLHIDGLTAARLRPQLVAAGVELPEGGLAVAAGLDARFGDALTFELTDLEIRGGDTPLTLPLVAVRGVRSDGEATVVDAIELRGPTLPLTKAEDGALHVAGLTLRTPRPPAEAEPVPGNTVAEQPSPTPADAGAAGLPQLRLGSFAWTDLALRWTDRSRTPVAELAIEDLDVHSDGLALGGDAEAGKLRASFSLPDAAERVAVELGVTPRDAGLSAEVDLQASGLTLVALKPWLEPLGVRPELQAGELTMQAAADIELQDDATICDVRVGGIALVDGDTRWFSLDGVTGEGMRIGERFDAGTWTVRAPHLRVHRDADQSLHVMGVHLAAAPSTPAAPTDDTGAVDPAAAAPRSAAERLFTQPGAQRRRLRLPNTDEPLFEHGPLRLEGLTIAFRDARQPDRTFDLGLDAELGEHDASGEPLPVRATIHLDRAVRSCTVDATLKLTPTNTVLAGDFELRGLVGEELALLLPEGVRCTTEDGNADARFELRLAAGETHSEITASVTGLRLLDGERELFAIDELTAALPTVADDQVHVEKLRVAGVRAEITQTDDAMLVPGFELAAAPAATTEPPAPSDTAEPTTPTRPAGTDEADRDAAAAAGEAAATAEILAPPMRIPSLRIDAIELELQRLALHDRRGGRDVEPLVVEAGMRLGKPWRGDPSATEAEPLQLVVEAGIAPLGGRIEADLQVSPFELSPTMDLEFVLSDLDTTRLAEVMPGLEQQIRGEATALELRAAVHARLDLRRRDPANFPLHRPFGAELVVENVRIADTASDTVYASVASIDVIARAIDPRTGSVLLRSVDVDAPVANLRQDELGMHVAGFVLPPAVVPVESPPNPDAPRQPAPKPAPRPAPNPDGALPPEFAIDRLRVLGVEVSIADHTTTPPTDLAIVDTDLEVQRFSTRATVEPHPISFTLAVRGGDVELERRVIRSSVLSGLVSSGAEALVGGADEHQMERRPLLDRLLVDGRVQLYPQLLGRINIALDRLELAAFRGLAKQSGVEIADGLLDMRVRADLRGLDGIDVESEHVFTHLALTEPPGGPISTYLRMPAPLQTMLFLLRNNDNEQRLPIDVHVPANGISMSAITDLAVDALRRLISDAVGSAGSRFGSTVLDPLRNLFAGDGEVPDVQVSVPFEAGSPLPGAADLQPLFDAVEGEPTLTIVLTHELGAADLPHARELANPPTEVIERTTARLQQKRRDLEARRGPLAKELLSLYAAGDRYRARRLQDELDKFDAQLGELLGAMLRAFEQLGNTDERSAQRRTRAAAQSLATARLDALREDFVARLPELADGRIEVRSGRGVPVAGIDSGGRITAVVRRRTVKTVSDDAPNRARRLADRKPSDQRTSVGPEEGSRMLLPPPRVRNP